MESINHKEFGFPSTFFATMKETIIMYFPTTTNCPINNNASFQGTPLPALLALANSLIAVSSAYLL